MAQQNRHLLLNGGTPHTIALQSLQSKYPAGPQGYVYVYSSFRSRSLQHQVRITYPQNPIDPVLRLRTDPTAGLNHITGITQVPLSTWQAMTAEEIRRRMPGAPGAKKRFNAALQRFQKIKLALATLSGFNLLMCCPARTLSPLLELGWERGLLSVPKLFQFSVEPRNLTRKCPNPGTLPESMSSEWLLRFDAGIAAIQQIIDQL